MEGSEENGRVYTTVAMAEILLSQDMLKDAARVIAALEVDFPAEPRVSSLRRRLAERLGKGDPVQSVAEPSGADRLELFPDAGNLAIHWELTDGGLALARRQVRYSGQSIVRLFTAAGGRRGVRTATRDFDLEHHCGKMTLSGMPTPAFHTAAVGFLGRNGAFVPMARALPVAGNE